MNSRFKFPRRVRIHGGECGAVARALHHEAKGLSLCQADLEKASKSTIERKQMSTKTTLKRIALVAVSALGFGALSAAPSQSAVPTNYYNSSTTLSTTSLTVVGTAYNDTNTGKFYVDLTSTGTLADKYPGLQSDESLTVTVTAAPTATTPSAALTDLTIQPIKLSSATADSGFANVVNGANSAEADSDIQVPSGAPVANYVSNNWTPDANDDSGYENRYWFAVHPSASNKAIDSGTYTIRVRLINGDSNGVALIDKTISVTFVSNIANAGATLSLTATGDVYKTEGLSYVTGRNVKATLAGATSGSRVVMGTDHTGALSGQVVDLNANWVTVAGTVSTTDSFYEYDNGVAGRDHIAPSNSSIATNSTYTALRSIGDGVYGITTAATSGGDPVAIAQTAAADTVLRVRITNTSVSTTVAIIIRDTTTARDNKVDLTMAATGSVAYNTTAGITTATAADVTRTDVDTSTTYVLPLTTTSGTLTINLDNASNEAVSGAVVNVTPTWSNSYVSTAVTPATSTTGTSYTSDASGNIAYAFTNSSPIDTGTLTLSITGFASGSGTIGTGSRTVVIVWQKPAITTMSVLDPVDGVYVKTGSTNTFTVAVLDQFGNGMSGELIQPSIPGSSDANYVLNKTYATITTGSAGTATWSLTDACSC